MSTRKHHALLTIALLAVTVAGFAPTAQSSQQTLAKMDGRLLAWDTAAARKLYDQLPDRSSAAARVAAGRLLAQERKFDLAVTELSRAAEAAPTDPRPVLWLGETHLLAERAGDARTAFTRAVERAEAALKKTPDDAGLLLALGTARQRLRQLPQATSALERAQKLAPGNAEIAFQLGVTRAVAQDWRPAVDLLTAALERNPEIAHAYYTRALAAEKIGRKDLLINDLEQFLALAPEAPEAPRARRILDALRR